MPIGLPVDTSLPTDALITHTRQLLTLTTNLLSAQVTVAHPLANLSEEAERIGAAAEGMFSGALNHLHVATANIEAGNRGQKGWSSIGSSALIAAQLANNTAALKSYMPRVLEIAVKAAHHCADYPFGNELKRYAALAAVPA